MKIKENHTEKDTHKLNEMVIHVTINKTKKDMHIPNTLRTPYTHSPKCSGYEWPTIDFHIKSMEKIHNVNDKARGEK